MLSSLYLPKFSLGIGGVEERAETSGGPEGGAGGLGGEKNKLYQLGWPWSYVCSGRIW